MKRVSCPVGVRRLVPALALGLGFILGPVGLAKAEGGDGRGQPGVTITSPADQSLSNARLLLVKVFFFGEGHDREHVISKVVLKQDGVEVARNENPGSAPSATLTFRVDLSSVKDGAHTFQAFVDHRGDQTQASDPVQVILDRSLPSVTLNLADGQVIWNGLPRFGAALSDVGTGIDAQRTTMSVDGRPLAATLGKGLLTYQVTTALANGVHTLKVTAIDRAGNQRTEQAQFTVQPLPITSNLDGDMLDDAWKAANGFSTNALDNPYLKGWWQMDRLVASNVVDRTSNHVDGVLLHFAPSPDVTGLLSNGLFYSRSRAVVNFQVTNAGVASALNLADFTMSLWIKGSAVDVGQMSRLVRWSDVNGSAWELGTDTNGFAFLEFSQKTPDEKREMEGQPENEAPAVLSQRVVGGVGSLSLLDNQWHQVVGVYAAGTSNAVVYVDGFPEASGVVTNNWQGTAVKSFAFGALGKDHGEEEGKTEGDRPEDGKQQGHGEGEGERPPPDGNPPFVMDEVRLYNAALSSDEIVNLPATFTDTGGNGVPNFMNFLQGATNLNGAAYVNLYYSNLLGPGKLPVLSKISGDNQSGKPSSFLPKPLVVSVDTVNHAPIVNGPVTFTVAQGLGKLSISSNGAPLVSSLNVRTENNGRASVFFWLPPTQNTTNLIAATVSSGSNSVCVTFMERTAPQLIRDPTGQIVKLRVYTPLK